MFNLYKLLIFFLEGRGVRKKALDVFWRPKYELNILCSFETVQSISSNSDSSGHDIEFYEYFLWNMSDVGNTIFLTLKIRYFYWWKYIACTYIFLDKSLALSGSTMSLRLYRSCGANTEWRQHLSSIRSCVPGNILITIIFLGNNSKYLEISW